MNDMVEKPTPMKWEDFFFNTPKVSEDFMQERNDLQPQKRKSIESLQCKSPPLS